MKLLPAAVSDAVRALVEAFGEAVMAIVALPTPLAGPTDSQPGAPVTVHSQPEPADTLTLAVPPVAGSEALVADNV